MDMRTRRHSPRCEKCPSMPAACPLGWVFVLVSSRLNDTISFTPINQLQEHYRRRGHGSKRLREGYIGRIGRVHQVHGIPIDAAIGSTPWDPSAWSCSKFHLYVVLGWNLSYGVLYTPSTNICSSTAEGCGWLRTDVDGHRWGVSVI